MINTKQNSYVIILSTLIKASTKHNSANLVKLFVASPVLRLRKIFTLCVSLTLSRLIKLGKVHDLPGFRVVRQEHPRQSDPNTDADCDEYCRRTQDFQQLIEY